MTMRKPDREAGERARERAIVTIVLRAALAGAGSLRAFGALAGAAVAVAGCYNPNITDGGFLCGGGDGGTRCPEGFTCNLNDHRCYKSGETTCSTQVTPLCQDPPKVGATCNPACQTGCACGRCNIEGSAPVCAASVGTKTLGQTCSPTNDDCQPGLICLLEGCGTQLGRCYQHCTSTGQCHAGTACSIPILNGAAVDTGYRACDLAPQDCDPIGKTGCPNAALTCYLDSAGATLCDCPNRTVAADGACSVFNDCAAGLVCVTPAGATTARCRPICLQSGQGGCPNGRRCIADGARYGYCSVN
jgi:hypothetical protein